MEKKKDKVLVVLEKMQEDIRLIAEGQQMLREDVNRRFTEVGKRFDQVDGKFVEIGRRFSGIEDNLKAALEYLFRIDEEIGDIKKELEEKKKTEKINKSWTESIEKRIALIEKQLKARKQLAR
jgi:septation ring formation regulator EzrA